MLCATAPCPAMRKWHRHWSRGRVFAHRDTSETRTHGHSLRLSVLWICVPPGHDTHNLSISAERYRANEKSGPHRARPAFIDFSNHSNQFKTHPVPSRQRRSLWPLRQSPHARRLRRMSIPAAPSAARPSVVGSGTLVGIAVPLKAAARSALNESLAPGITSPAANAPP